MTEPGRTPHTSSRSEGDPPGDEETDGRTPHTEEPAEGEDVQPGQGVDTPGE
jgi:hypothetical protein